MAKALDRRPRDPNQLGKLIVDIATGQVEDTVSAAKKNPKRKGRAGGLKGGKARAQSLTPEQRQAISKSGTLARWKKKTN